MGCAAFFGLTLISGSKTLLVLAIFSALSHWWFLSKVEKYVLCPSNRSSSQVLNLCYSPHMKKLYGNAVRKEAGLTKTIKTVAKRNVQIRAPALSQVVKEVQGTIEKVTKETSEMLDEFLEKCELPFSS
jgi:phosphatidylethanolamine N-methyltransferase